MKVKIKRIDPLQFGKVLAVTYALFSLVFIPFFLIAAIAGSAQSGRDTGGIELVMVIVFPLLYIVFGFIGGIIGAWIYNLVAKWVGGVELTFDVDSEQA